MNIKPIQNFKELYYFVIRNSPLDLALTFFFWWYIYIWCWLSLLLYNCEGVYRRDKLIAVVIYKKSVLYFVGIAKAFRHKGLARKLVKYSGCTKFALNRRALDSAARSIGFVRTKFNFYKKLDEVK